MWSWNLAKDLRCIVEPETFSYPLNLPRFASALTPARFFCRSSCFRETSSYLFSKNDGPRFQPNGAASCSVPQRLRLLRQRRHRRPLLRLLQGVDQEEAAASLQHAGVVVADVDADSHRREVAESAGHAVSFSRNSFSHSLVSGQGER